MVKTRVGWQATLGGLIALGAGIAAAQTPPGTAATAPVAPAFGTPVTVYASTREFVWTLKLLELTTERVAVTVQVPDVKLRGRRWDYEAPGLVSKRFKLGQLAEFNCRYGDWGLPETCRTEWHDVYADLPVLAMVRDHIEYDAAEWVVEERTIHIDVPHWTWREGRFTLSLPTFGPSNPEQAQVTLDARQAAAAKAIDAGIATLDRSIAAVAAQGADPSRVAQGGKSLDLLAMRQALRAEQQEEVERFASIRGELRSLSDVAPPPPATPTAAP